jgi:hypothetical protein
MHDSGLDFPYYDVDHAVGPNCPNRTDDVMLVQYLLLKFYGNPKRTAIAPAGEMRVTGFCGPVTRRWILAFQMYLGAGTAVDGQIDPTRGRGVSTISHTVYTIINLCNMYFQDLTAIGQTTRYVDLDKEPDVPLLLKTALGPST